VSLSPEAIELIDRHADGRSRSRCVEEELLRALRAREWELLSSQIPPGELEDQLDWAGSTYAFVDEYLARGENAGKRKRRSRPQRRRKAG
jgi:hypothetical protein